MSDDSTIPLPVDQQAAVLLDQSIKDDPQTGGKVSASMLARGYARMWRGSAALSPAGKPRDACESRAAYWDDVVKAIEELP